MRANYTHFPVLMVTILLFTTSLSISQPSHAQGWRGMLDKLLGKEPAQPSSQQETRENGLDPLSNLSSLLTDDELIDAFKEALVVGSEQVVTQLGAKNGFNTDELIHIPLPKNVQKARKLLERIGMESIADDLELKLNRAAEAAAPEAKDLFITAIKSMSFDDIRSIYTGPKDSATQYFRDKTSAELSERMRPIIDASLAEVGALAAYDQFIDNYSSIPFVPDLKANLNDYVLAKGMDGIFYYLAEEEAAIREDPVKRTSDLLRRVFSK